MSFTPLDGIARLTVGTTTPRVPSYHGLWNMGSAIMTQPGGEGRLMHMPDLFSDKWEVLYFIFFSYELHLYGLKKDLLPLFLTVFSSLDLFSPGVYLAHLLEQKLGREKGVHLPSHL